MHLVLDTHTLIWLVGQPSKVSSAALTVIAEPSNTVMVSAASIWELATKVRLGKLPEAEPILLNLGQVMDELDAVALPVTHAHAQLAGSLIWDHGDPFDRMLAAQSLLENAVLVGLDKAFDALEGVRRLW